MYQEGSVRLSGRKVEWWMLDQFLHITARTKS